MSQVNINYLDLQGYDFEEIRSRLILHLTPPESQKIHPVTRWDLAEAKNAIQTQRSYEVNFLLDSAYAGHIARDLGLFTDVDPDKLQERYRVTRPMGGSSSHRISIFGQEVGGIGDYPLTIRIQSDDAGLYQADELFLLTSWRDVLASVDEDKDRFAQAVMETFRSMQGVSREHEQMMHRFPSTLEEFDGKIAEMRERLWGIMFEGTLNILRFGYDFFGQPIEGMGIHPDHIRVVGSGSFEMILREAL